MRPMATMYTQGAIIVVFTKALYTCATLYPEATMSTKKIMSPMATVYTRNTTTIMTALTVLYTKRTE